MSDPIDPTPAVPPEPDDAGERGGGFVDGGGQGGHRSGLPEQDTAEELDYIGMEDDRGVKK